MFINELNAHLLFRRLQRVSASISGHLQGKYLRYSVIYLCKVFIPIVILYYKTRLVSV